MYETLLLEKTLEVSHLILHWILEFLFMYLSVFLIGN